MKLPIGTFHQVGAVWCLMLIAGPVLARTVVITDLEIRKMAVIDGIAPRLSWAATGSAGNYSNFHIELSSTAQNRPTVLIQFPLKKVPDDMRVTSAELVFVSHLVYPDVSPRLHVRRIIGDWGPGVCHMYRRTRPEKVEWTEPGAEALGFDRARRPTAIVRLKAPGEHVVNVTEDVELWCSGAAENHGWMIYMDDPGAIARINNPPWSPGHWKLRITFEPR